MSVSSATPEPDDPRARIIEDHRPWGSFRQFTHGEPTTVKIITVHPEQDLSLQRHEHRDELWVALDRGLHVRIGDLTARAQVGEEFFIPRGTIHRASARGERPARFLEVAFGRFDEDDIERLEDRYGRE